MAIVQPFEVKVSPNPSNNDFRIQVITSSNDPLFVRLTNVSGTDLKVNTTLIKGSIITVGSELKAGTYFAEVIQGTNRKTVKLVKLN